MDVSGKFWGRTSKVFSGVNVEVHYIDVDPGGFCSEHRHRAKFNQFFVLDGELKVLTWKAGDALPPDETVLRRGESTTVAPGVFHKFVCLQACKALEIYWTELEESDIERRDIGGRA